MSDTYKQREPNFPFHVPANLYGQYLTIDVFAPRFPSNPMWKGAKTSIVKYCPWLAHAEMQINFKQC